MQSAITNQNNPLHTHTQTHTSTTYKHTLHNSWGVTTECAEYKLWEVHI